MIVSAIYALKQAFMQIRRNIIMTIASLFSITAIMIVLGILFIVVINVNNLAETVKQDFDSMQLYLNDDVSRERATEISAQIEEMTEVDSVAYLSREEAMENWKAKWGDNSSLLERLKKNPLPNSLVVKVIRLEDADTVYNAVKDYPEVYEVSYYQDTVKKLISITHAVQVVAMIIMIFMVIISVVVVSNTIKLTVLARSKEIMIMKFIGATSWFIRLPFLFEGIILGVIAAGAGGGIIVSIYSFLIDKFGRDIVLMLSMGLLPTGVVSSNLFIIFISLGVFIGAFGSVISMRRFLDK
jgi:cell division transport system permease protein